MVSFIRRQYILEVVSVHLHNVYHLHNVGKYMTKSHNETVFAHTKYQ